MVTATEMTATLDGQPFKAEGWRLERAHEFGRTSVSITLVGDFTGVTWDSVHQITIRQGDEQIQGEARLRNWRRIRRIGSSTSYFTFAVTLKP